MPQQTLCGCSERMLNVQDVSYVYRGIPYCDLSCMQRAEERDERPRAARDVPVGQPWTFKHRTLGDIIRIEERDGRLVVAP